MQESRSSCKQLPSPRAAPASHCLRDSGQQGSGENTHPNAHGTSQGPDGKNSETCRVSGTQSDRHMARPCPSSVQHGQCNKALHRRLQVRSNPRLQEFKHSHILTVPEKQGCPKKEDAEGPLPFQEAELPLLVVELRGPPGGASFAARPSSQQVHTVLQQFLPGFAREAEGAVLRAGEAGAPSRRCQLLEVGLLGGAATGIHGRGGIPGRGERER